MREHSPILDRVPIQIPYVQRIPQPRTVSLNQVHDMAPFERLGATLTSEADTTLRRTVLRAEGGQIRAERAEDIVQATVFDLPLEDLQRSLVERVMQVRGVERGEARFAPRRRL